MREPFVHPCELRKYRDVIPVIRSRIVSLVLLCGIHFNFSWQISTAYCALFLGSTFCFNKQGKNSQEIKR